MYVINLLLHNSYYRLQTDPLVHGITREDPGLQLEFIYSVHNAIEELVSVVCETSKIYNINQHDFEYILDDYVNRQG